ncbi:Zn-ribbon domain-containing OB-fold protein [Sporosarcina newyorkensis]|uniref:Zn-ribbon domain-containing OB-fold protein n=1 Tax=Sporosarcina newyorkensis TaxID=759851 RepID=A0A1T4XZ09_9BACL|nr:Zn-ribbon domain-containing OB-fold protein [Sporosarcina newyorkensis]SKA94797.1 hypothetical protein SAMN04244570_1475 [Sporosarcina newyorkensis]
MEEIKKPVPIADGDSLTFWEGCKEDKLLIQRCEDCDKFIFYPRIVCPNCMSENIEWVESAGKGKVYSFTVVRHSPPSFSDDVPYVVAMIELDEGVRMISNIVECEIGDVYCDMSVEVVFEEREDAKLPMFRPLTDT